MSDKSFFRTVYGALITATIIALLGLFMSSCNVNFNILPQVQNGKVVKDEKPKEAKKQKPITAVKEKAVKPPQTTPAKIEAPKEPCKHNTVFATSIAGQYACSCWDCGEIWPCTIK